MSLRSLVGRLEQWPTRRLMAMVFVASVLVTIAFWAVLPARLRQVRPSDFTGFYEPVARNILAGNGIRLDDGQPATRYSPGYPILLAGLFGVSDALGVSEDTALSAFTLLFSGLNAVLIFVLARGWGLGPALVSALLWVTCPFALWLTKHPFSEIPFITALLAAFYVLVIAMLRDKPGWSLCLLAGVLAGFAMLIRPIAIGVGIVMGLILWLGGRPSRARVRLALVGVLLLGSIVAVLPWEIWVCANKGKFVPLSTGGPPSMRDGLTFAVAHADRRESPPVPADVEQLQRALLARSDELKSFGSVIAVLWEYLQTQPVAVVKLFVIKATRCWYGTDSGRFEKVNLLVQLPYLLLGLYGSVAAWRRRGNARRLTIAVWLFVLYFWGVSTLVLSVLRYLVPAMALLFVLIPAGFAGTYALAAATPDSPALQGDAHGRRTAE